MATFPSVTSFPPPRDVLSRIEHCAGVSSDELPFADSVFDLVYSVAALEHVPDPHGTFAK